MKKDRIWELDFFRGIFILCVILIHGIYDAQVFLNWDFNPPPIYDFIQYNGSILFILLSGICITLGHHFVRRGAIVFACGILISAVLKIMVALNLMDDASIIYWGILHLLGFCMLSYILLKRLPTWLLGFLGVAIIVLGFYVETVTPDTIWLCPFGFTPYGFATADFFPIFPYWGWFMVGIVLGRLLYKEKKTLLPKFPYRAWPIRAIAFCGRHSLWIYLGHQPILYGIMMLFA